VEFVGIENKAYNGQFSFSVIDVLLGMHSDAKFFSISDAILPPAVCTIYNRMLVIILKRQKMKINLVVDYKSNYRSQKNIGHSGIVSNYLFCEMHLSKQRFVVCVSATKT